MRFILSKSGISFLSLTFVLLLFNCNDDLEYSSRSLSFSEDSARINQQYLEYVDIVNSDYAHSRYILKKLFDTLNALPEERQVLTIQFFSFISVSEASNGNMERADSLTNLAIQRAWLIGDKDYFDVAYQNRGIWFWYSGQLDSAKIYIEAAARYAKETEDLDQLLAAKTNLASFLQFDGGYKEPIKILSELIETFKNIEQWQYMADACNNLAGIYLRMGQLYSALKYYHLAVETYDKIDSKLNYLHPINNLAIIYSRLGMDSLAFQNFKRVSQLAKETKNVELFCSAGINMAEITFQHNETAIAYDSLISILNYLEENSKTLSINNIQCYISLGRIEKERGNFEQSIKYLNEARKLSLALKMTKQHVNTSQLLAGVYMNRKDYDNAQMLAHIGMDSALKYELIEEIKDISLLLAKLYHQTNNIEKSFRYYAIYEKNEKAYLDTITAHKAKDFAYYCEIQKIESETRLLQKDKELVEIINASNQQKIKQQKIIIILGVILVVLLLVTILIIIRQSRHRANLNTLLKEENDFKNNLFSIVSHDLRSPIVSLYQMFVIITKKSFSVEKMKKFETELLKKTEKTIDLIDNLLFWTKEQLKGNESRPEKIQVQEMISNIVSNELESSKINGIHFESLIPEELTIFADRNVVHLVLRNLISNAFKFTPLGGKIMVNLIVESNEIIFAIKDTGSGIKPEEQDKIMSNDEIVSMQGMHGEQGKGLGLLLCKFFIQKCGGKIWFESVESEGTCFYFSLPHKVENK